MIKKIFVVILIFFVASAMSFAQKGPRDPGKRAQRMRDNIQDRQNDSKKMDRILESTALGRPDSPGSPAQRMTNTGEDSAYAVQVSEGNNVHVAWREGDSVQYRKNTNNGAAGSWGGIQTLSGGGEIPDSSWRRPIDIAVSGSYVYVAMQWRYSSSDDMEIWFRRSTDSGATWGAWTRLTNNLGDSARPCLAASGANVYLLWQDDNPGNWEIFFKRSTDYGVTWGAALRLSYSAGSNHYPCMCAAGPYVYVAWEDNNPGNFEIYFKGSGNYGASFGPIWRVTYNTGFSWCPNIACDQTGQYVYLVWSDNNPGNYEIFFKRNTAYGTAGGWSGPLRICYTGGWSEHPDVDAINAVVDVVWVDTNPGNYEIFGKYSTTHAASFGTVARWTYNAGDSRFPRVSSNDWSIVWTDNNPGNNEIFYK